MMKQCEYPRKNFRTCKFMPYVKTVPAMCNAPDRPCVYQMGETSGRQTCEIQVDDITVEMAPADLRLDTHEGVRDFYLRKMNPHSVPPVPAVALPYVRKTRVDGATLYQFSNRGFRRSDDWEILVGWAEPAPRFQGSTDEYTPIA